MGSPTSNKRPLENDSDSDDMFSLSAPKQAKLDVGLPANFTANKNVSDNHDDSEGYYILNLGEVLDERYSVHSALGKGSFSAVVKANDKETGGQVAIKIIRSQEALRKIGMKEIRILEKLQEQEQDGKRRAIVKLERYFKHKGHLCLVFESLSLDMRELIKKFGKNVGLAMQAVKVYSSQLFYALAQLKKHGIVHADIKPDNILLNENFTVARLCDLGSAIELGTPNEEFGSELVSRFYRPPEIILGLPFDTAVDVWAFGCTIYELTTGQILFPGRDNNHMLKLMMELRGKFVHKTLRKGKYTVDHFDDALHFTSHELDSAGQPATRTIIFDSPPARTLLTRLVSAAGGRSKLKEEEIATLTTLADLLEKCLALDPQKRISAKDALLHPFFY